MKQELDRAFKEWAVACEAVARGEQILLVRKGGIREEGGVFQINDAVFFLMPTYEHQNAAQLQPTYATRLQQMIAPDPHSVTIRSYAVVDSILQARDEAQVNGLADEMIWNDAYVRQRFDFNPYDPLYLLILRVFNLPAPVTIPLLPAYVGCKSWVTLQEPLSTAASTPALDNATFAHRRNHLKQHMGV